jgi:UDP-N-acetylmuramyl pentapeptide synthase
MLELGVHSEMLHKALGEAVVKAGAAMLFTYGERALHIAESAALHGMPENAIFSFGQGEERLLARAISDFAPRSAAILFKASGKMKLGQIVEMVREEEQGGR